MLQDTGTMIVQFAAPSLLNDDDAMESLWKKQFSLAEIVAPDQFKTYDELKLV